MRTRTFRPQLELLDGRCLPSLSPAVSYPAGDNPGAAVTADFNNDGRLDLATTTAIGVGVLLGAGDGTFGAAQHFPTIGRFLAAGDFNGDGHTDLATSWIVRSYDSVGFEYVDGGLDVLLGNGDGTFQPARGVPVPPPDSSLYYGQLSSYAPIGLRAADANADGRSDLWVDADYDTFIAIDMWGGGTYSVVLLGLPDGSFTGGSTENFPPPPPAPDLNADGRGDAVVAGYNGVSVRLGRADGTFSPEMRFLAGQSTAGLAVGDFNGDGRADVAATNAGSDNVSVLLNDGVWPPADAPTVWITNPVVTEGNAGTMAAVFTVSLSAAYGQPVEVGYATVDGSATGGSDYQAVSGTLTFAPGETSKTITVLVNGDRVAEPNEWFSIKLSEPTNAFVAYGQGVGGIMDDEPRISISDVTKFEGNGKKTTLFVFTVTLSVAYDQPVTMSFRTADSTATTSDSDYVAKTGTLTFAPGETTKTITIVVNCDKKKEADETFYLDLFGLSSNALFTKSRGVGTILNDD